ncbi:MAG: RluA family pseudouridine synthase, partial [Rhodanobacter sp.]
SLAKQFANHTIERAYHALVWGTPRTSSGSIESQIGRSQFDRKRMAVLRSGGKTARTNYRVLEKFGDPARPFASLVECRLETGRTHQIRVHLTHIGHPLVGDPLYGGGLKLPKGASEQLIAALRGFRRQALHAEKLSFTHPATGVAMAFAADRPADMDALVDMLRTDLVEHGPDDY